MHSLTKMLFGAKPSIFSYLYFFRLDLFRFIKRLKFSLLSLKELFTIFYTPMRYCRNVSNRSVLLTYQLRRFDDVSAWSRTLKLVTKNGQFLLGTNAVIVSETSGDSASLRYRLVRRCNISKTSVSFSY